MPNRKILKILPEDTRFIRTGHGIMEVVSDSYGFVKYITPDNETIFLEGTKLIQGKDTEYDIIEVLTRYDYPELYL